MDVCNFWKLEGMIKGNIATTPELNRNKNAVKFIVLLFKV